MLIVVLPVLQLFEALQLALCMPLEYNRTGACAMYSFLFMGVPVLLHVDASSQRFPDDKPLLSVTNIRQAVDCKS